MPFYDRLDVQKSENYGKRIKIQTDLRKYSFELVYRKQETGYHRTVTAYDLDGNIINVDSHQQQMIGEFSEENVKNQFDQFISEGWQNYVN